MTNWHFSRAALETARVSAPTIVQGVLGTLTPEVCDRRLDSWSRRLVEQAEIHLSVEGRENIRSGETFIVMSNHQSHYDIPVLFQALRIRVRMVTKKELFRIPGFGQAMRAAGFVEVDRQNRARAIESLKRAEQALAQGTNIWIAPEGTRSPTGRLGPFKKGGFVMALETGARILPVSISGTRDALVARGRRVSKGARVRVVIHPPIDPSEYGTERREALMDVVRQVLASEIREEQVARARRTAAPHSGSGQGN